MIMRRPISTQPPSQQPTALCISEDKSFLNHLRVTLGKSGFTAITTTASAEGAALAEHNTIDAIICDYDLTTTDGATLIERIREQRAPHPLPPTVVTAEQYAPPLHARVLTAGAVYLHSKSDPIDVLVSKVISLLKDTRMQKYAESMFATRDMQMVPDPLTRVASKKYFIRRFAAESSAATRDTNALSLLLIGVDRYRYIVDKHGKKNIDALLAGTARLIEGELRSRDSVGRFDECVFAVALPDTDHAAAKAVGDRLRRLIKATEFGNLDQSIQITVSVGVSTRPPQNRIPPESIVEQAEQNLAMARELNGDRLIADERLSGQSVILLVANDDLASRSLIRDLNDLGIEVHSAHNSGAAQFILEERLPTAIAAIDPLPEDETADFLHWARNKYPRVKRLLICARITPELMRRAVNDAAINAFLYMPWQAEDLKALADQLKNA